MNAVKVTREKLLAVLRTNRDNHRKIFLEAQVNYRAQAIAELERSLQEARDNKRIRRTLTLVEPMDQTWEYDRAIKMLEMSVDEEILLSEQDFRQFVMDQWSWKSSFLHSNRGYSMLAMDEIEATEKGE